MIFLILFLSVAVVFFTMQWLRVKAARRQESREERLERQQEELERLLKK